MLLLCITICNSLFFCHISYICMTTFKPRTICSSMRATHMSTSMAATALLQRLARKRIRNRSSYKRITHESVSQSVFECHIPYTVSATIQCHTMTYAVHGAGGSCVCGCRRWRIFKRSFVRVSLNPHCFRNPMFPQNPQTWKYVCF